MRAPLLAGLKPSAIGQCADPDCVRYVYRDACVSRTTPAGKLYACNAACAAAVDHVLGRMERAR